MSTAVLVDALRKRYPGSDTLAVDGFDLPVPAGTVHWLPGPDGAGKTAAVRFLTTLLRADGGDGGGRGVFEGPPADLLHAPASFTDEHLARHVRGHQRAAG